MDCSAHLFICQGEEPSHAALQPFREMQTQCLNQHHVREVLRTKKAPGCRSSKFALHPSRECKTQCRNHHHVRGVWRTREAPGCGSSNSSRIRSSDQRMAALS